MSQATDTEVRADGRIESVSGPVVTAVDMDARMNDVVYVGDEGLMGEVIEIEGNITTIQVYEETSNVSPGEPVESTGAPLSVDLGPGMLDAIYDGVQRPLDVLETKMDSAFLDRGVDAPGIDLEKTWEFEPTVDEGDEVESGDIVGSVPETPSIDHKVMVPPDSDGGEVVAVESGTFTVEETVVELDTGEEIAMRQEWPVREARPAEEKQTPTTPLVSGQRILDGLFPIAKGGTAAIPGPFGSGKCVTPDTPVLLADGERVPIEELFDRLAGDRAGDGETLVEADAEILTFDENANAIRPAEISHVYRGSTDKIVRVTTASGRELEVTPDHKLFRMRGDLRVEETPAGALDVGDSLVMPREIDTAGELVDLDPYELAPEARAVESDVIAAVQEAIDTADISKATLAEDVGVTYDVFMNYALGRTNPPLAFIDDLFDRLGMNRPTVRRVKPGSNGKTVTLPDTLTAEFAEFLGLLLADGMITEKAVRFHNSDADLRAKFASLAEDLFDIPAVSTVHNTIDTVEIYSRTLSQLLSAIGVPETKKSNRASIPDHIFASEDEVAAAFLRGYYLGDGSMNGGEVEISTSSDAMASGLPYLLSRFGILFRVRQRDNGANRVLVTGADELETLANTLSDGDDVHPKIEAIHEYARTTTGNTNVDTVPVGSRTLLEIADAARYADYAEGGVEMPNYTGLDQQPSRSAF
ncbi:MAG: LAGLIDADG family homing endonuclease [Salinirussus sp.]